MDRPRPGEKLRARTLTDIQDRGQRNTIISSEEINVSRGAVGTSLEVEGTGSSDRFWIQLTTAGTGLLAGKYVWNYSTRTVAGGWIESGIGGDLVVDCAFEANNFATLSLPKHVEVKRDPGTNQIIFQLESC